MFRRPVKHPERTSSHSKQRWFRRLGGTLMTLVAIEVGLAAWATDRVDDTRQARDDAMRPQYVVAQLNTERVAAEANKQKELDLVAITRPSEQKNQWWTSITSFGKTVSAAATSETAHTVGLTAGATGIPFLGLIGVGFVARRHAAGENHTEEVGAVPTTPLQERIIHEVASTTVYAERANATAHTLEGDLSLFEQRLNTLEANLVAYQQAVALKIDASHRRSPQLIPAGVALKVHLEYPEHAPVHAA